MKSENNNQSNKESLQQRDTKSKMNKPVSLEVKGSQEQEAEDEAAKNSSRKKSASKNLLIDKENSTPRAEEYSQDL